MLDQKLLKKIDRKRLPAHVAIIMDGNGRWAKKHLLRRIEGHRAGVKAVDDTVTSGREIGLKALTLYAFSTENWNRPKSEVKTLMDLLVEYLDKEVERMEREGIRFNTIGNIDDLPERVRLKVHEVEARTGANNDMILTLALSYGSRAEIISAIRKIIGDLEKGTVTLHDLDEALLDKYLDTSGLPPCDLLIRTSGELRLSNFLLWQLAYTELYFTKALWPDFRGNDLLKAIIAYQKRERRYGLTREQINPTKRYSSP